jgi:MFS family permease
MALLSFSHHWALAAFGMLLFGMGWTAAYATMQASAQLACPPWVRARALSIYQLAQNGALTVGSFAWGWLAGHIGMPITLALAAGIGALLAVAALGFRIEAFVPPSVPAPSDQALAPEAPAAELVPLLRNARGRVMETAHYNVTPAERDAFMAIMREIRLLRGRTGAQFWQLYENVAHPEGWVEIWSMESWTDHLREAGRLSDSDRAVLARAAAFQHETNRPARYLAVDP